MIPSNTDTEEFHPQPETGETAAGIYVHIPFCRSKCPYCSFVSYPDMGADIKNNYINALQRQMLAMASHPWSRSRKFHSLFIGGGTPSSVDPPQMAAFIEACLAAYDFSALPDRKPEVTLEVNPNGINGEMLQRFRDKGVNRLSIGVQSFGDEMLRSIGRRHTASEAVNAFETARTAGFANINLDLMYGLPGQDIVDWQNSLQQAIALAPDHISVYELTIEENTPFAEAARRKKLHLPPEETTVAMFEMAQEVLAPAGYSHYEISNYARPGFACIHNVNYWENGSYLGLGAASVSCFSGVRIRSEENPVLFIQMMNSGRMTFKEAEFLPLEARFRETVIMGLRMTAGVSISRLEERFGLTPQLYYGDVLHRLTDQGFLQEEEDRLRLTRQGVLLANRVMAQLV